MVSDATMLKTVFKGHGTKKVEKHVLKPKPNQRFSLTNSLALMFCHSNRKVMETDAQLGDNKLRALPLSFYHPDFHVIQVQF